MATLGRRNTQFVFAAVAVHFLCLSLSAEAAALTAAQRQTPNCARALNSLCPRETLELTAASPDVNCLRDMNHNIRDGMILPECCIKTQQLVDCWMDNLPPDCEIVQNTGYLGYISKVVTTSCESPTPTVSPTPKPTYDPMAPTKTPAPPPPKVPKPKATQDPHTKVTANGARAQDNPNSCFPAVASVQLEGGSRKQMHQLSVGDRVLTSTGYSPIFFFSHKLDDGKRQFMRIQTENGRVIELTASHLLPVRQSGTHLVAAGKVIPGDVIISVVGASEVVQSVSSVSRSGLYNPHTVSGDLIVDGILTSCYTTSVTPALAHGILLAPVRMIYMLTSGRAVLPDILFNRLSDILALYNRK